MSTPQQVVSVVKTHIGLIAGVFVFLYGVFALLNEPGVAESSRDDSFFLGADTVHADAPYGGDTGGGDSGCDGGDGGGCA